MPEGTLISTAVGGLVDEAVVRRLIGHVGAVPGPVYGKQGKRFLQQKIPGYNNAARHEPWAVLVDLDRDYDCAPPLRNAWIPKPARHLCFRIAVREVEAWLMADVDAIAAFLSVAPGRITRAPETLDDPKAEMVHLARHSRRRAIREDMVPRDGSGRLVGPAYASRLIEYVTNRWRPDVATQCSDSLRRALDCLRRLSGRDT
jgi:hypothetical protein